MLIEVAVQRYSIGAADDFLIAFVDLFGVLQSLFGQYVCTCTGFYFCGRSRNGALDGGWPYKVEPYRATPLYRAFHWFRCIIVLSLANKMQFYFSKPPWH